MLLAFVAALWLGLAGAAPAEPLKLDKGRIDAALARMVADGRVAGASALVWQDGQERYFGTSGFADREANKPMRRDTLVQIWSMTKPVTGVALMQLWEQGRFRLDDPVALYLPEFGQVKVVDKAGALRAPARPMTVRDLLRHTAGLAYGMRPGPADVEYRKVEPLALTNTLSEAGVKLAQVPLLFDPGQEWSYSASVDVQAMLVEKLSGQTHEAYVREHILAPLKMKDTAWTQPEANFARLAATYVAGTDGKIARQADVQTRRMNFDPARRMTMGGAGLVSSLDDYMRFARMLLNGGELDGARILKPSTVKLMATDQLDPSMKDRFFLPTKGAVGFGFDFAVRTGQPKTPGENRGAVGEFFWDGAATTLFFVDPANKAAAVFFVQKMPFDVTLHRDFREAVYGKGYLGPKGD
ncbi:serine hydrolase [Phenylobacterium sp. J367]|uniref:serine hydrolase domain-containing protein n=1 Tax=Phenylobacterium sp. J367 TaxID=2898435 RepID=UPI002151F700|nr:serine hydrolase domain-containing protein [Phenylobacterium sp. J367]MCR5880847.1 beta-lactamase family protein [Phenylobacterium sp. J367]